MGVQIPRIFTLMNAYVHLESRVHARNEYEQRFAAGKASDCVRCGLCDLRCPNGIPVSALLQQAADMFE